MQPRPIDVTPEQARRFLVRVHRLDAPHPDVATALDHLGYVQMDPINVCGRMHDLILRNRVAGYREGDLLNSIYAEAGGLTGLGFKHYMPGNGVLATLPLDAWPMVAAAIRRRQLHRGAYEKNLSPAHEKLARRILGDLAERGPLTSDDIEHDGTSMTDWGIPGRLVKNLLEVLFVHGRVLIGARRGFRRVYDLPERVLPREVWETSVPAMGELELWSIRQRLRQYRLVRLPREDWQRMAAEVQPVRVSGCPPLFCRREDVDLLQDSTARCDRGIPAGNGRVCLLAPLDPVIYDRVLARRLWDFDYTWEVYTPPAKRVRGYYALPVLAREAIVGHVDPKADRESRRLRVMSRRVRRGHATADAVRELARFLGLR